MGSIKQHRITHREIREKANADSRSLLGQRSYYWPFKRLPGSELFAYALAGFEIALKYSEQVRESYSKLVEAWNLPGCQVIKHDALRYTPITYAWVSKVVKALDSDRAKSQYPDMVPTAKETNEKNADNPDWQTLLSYVSEIIRLGFNRKDDIAFNALKVVPGQSHSLIAALGFRSIVDNCGVETATVTSYKGDFERIMTDNVTTRPDRELRKKLNRGFKEQSFELHSDQTLLNLAEMWYRARVLCSTVREAADYYRIDPIDLSKRIAIVDDAVGRRREKH